MRLLDVVLKEYGEKEVSGEQDNPSILKYAKQAGFDWVGNDEVPWCSILINWAALQAGYERTNKANARSWLDVGEEIEVPELGDVVIFWRGARSGWQGHVALYINEENNLVRVLGGNQSDEINIAAYSKNQVLGYRRLKKVKYEKDSEKDLVRYKRDTQVPERLETKHRSSNVFRDNGNESMGTGSISRTKTGRDTRSRGIYFRDRSSERSSSFTNNTESSQENPTVDFENAIEKEVNRALKYRFALKFDLQKVLKHIRSIFNQKRKEKINE